VHLRDAHAFRDLALREVIGEAQPEDLATRDAAGNMGALEELTGQLKTDLYDLSDALTARYLSHLTPSRLTSS